MDMVSLDRRTQAALARLQRLSTNKAKPRPLPLSTEGYAYFIGPADGPVKIGYSGDPADRLYRLQTGYPKPLHLWAQAPGGRAQEAKYQARFASAWISGEWFARTPEIEAEIALLQGAAA